MKFKLFFAMVFFTGTSSSAFANINAVEVWEDFLRRLEPSGSTVSVVQNHLEDRMELNDFVVGYQDSTIGVNFEFNIGQAVLIENSDGSVSITLPQKFPMTMKFRDKFVTSISAIIDIQNMQAYAAGHSNQINYDYSADQIGLALQSLILEDARIGSDEVQFSMLAKMVSGSTTTVTSNLRKTTGRSTIEDLEISAMLAPKDADFTASLVSRIKQMTSTSSDQIPEHMSVQELDKALQAGLSSSSVINYKSGEIKMVLHTPDGDFSGSTNSAGASSRTSISQDGVSVQMDVNGTNFDIYASSLPLPFNGSLGSFVYGLNMPLMPKSEEQAFGVLLELNDLTLAEDLWAVFDPAKILPRDPISLRIDIGGMVKLLLNFFDSKQFEASTEALDKPINLSTVTLNSIEANALGANLSVQGNFEYSNDSRLGEFNEYLMLMGLVTANLSGANTLIESLSRIGIIDGQHVLMARSFMGMFAIPMGNDNFETEVRIDADGGVFVNQQRLH